MYDSQRWEALARGAIEFDSNPFTRLALGVVLFSAGRYDESREDLLVALELDGGGEEFDLAIAWQYLAMAEWHLGNHADARDYRDRALALVDRTAPRHAGFLWSRKQVDKVLGISD